MKKGFFAGFAVILGGVVQIYAQTGQVVLTTNQVKTSSAVNIGALYVPTNFLAYIRGDFLMSGSTNYAASSLSLSVQNSNGVLLASTTTTLAYSASAGAASWGMGYAMSGSTNVLCQGRGDAAESWNGQWQGSVALVPMATISGGTSPPIISGIGVSATNSTSATIVWNTDETANSTVEWGTTTAYGNQTNTAVFVTFHSISINNLTASTTYHYRVSTTNANGLSAVSADNAFVTPGGGVGSPIISGIGVGPTNSTDATIFWTTDQAANSTVQWGTTTGYGSTANTPAFVTAHSIGVNNLTASTIYHYRVSSTNATGQSAVSGDNSFVTPGGVGGGGSPLTNGLAGYWALDNNYNDSSGLGNNLTPARSPTFSAGFIGSALDDTKGGSASAPDNPAYAMGSDASFTVSCWVYPHNVSGINCVLAKGDFQSGINDTFVIYNSGSAFRFGLGDGSVFATVDAPVSLTPFTWYNLVGVYDSAAHEINFYVNGVGNIPVAWTRGTHHSTGALSIGAAPDHTYAFSGITDEVILWTNRALTGQEIAQVYTNATRGLTPLTYGGTANARTTIIFNGDARFSVTGANTNMPTYFQLYSWASNHNATVVNYSGGVPPPTPPNVEQIEDLTNSAMTAKVLSYVGPGTNVFWVTEIGINNIYIMTNGPLYGYWTASTIAFQLTNYFHLLSNAGVNVIPITVYPMIGLETSAGDGTLATGEQVRTYVNTAITNYTGVFATMDVTPWLRTNNTPMWWGPSESELNDLGNTNVAMHLNTLLNSKWP